MGKKRGHGASGRSPRNASRNRGTRGRRGPGLEPSPERIAAELARKLASEARCAVPEVESSLDAEMFASSLVSTWRLGPGAPIDADPEEEIGLRVVAALERAGDERALAVLRGMEAVGSEAVASASGAAARRLAEAGMDERAWRDGLGTAQARRALIMRDAVFDDAVNVLVEFERPGHEPYLVGVLIDHNLGGIAKDLLVGPSLAELEESVARAPTEVAGAGELRFDEIELAEAAVRSREALWRTEHTLDPPVSDDFAPQLAAVAAHVAALPEGGSYEPEEVSDSDRQAALDGFLASPEAEPFHDSGEVADLAMLAIDYCADYLDGGGRPLRWSPVVVELFMTWFLPRKVVREPEFFERAVPELLQAWVRYAGRVRGIPLAAVEEAAGAVAAFRDDMLALVRDESTWGPGKALAMAAHEAGVDLGDQAALDAFIDEYNARRAA
ncbi:MAG TPA: hypothetical protein VE780_17490 [Thermoleophilaceae bacterium]|jgi:hypothetical protein|nr:hypothetical protein [Thermoleophilaceae bacterium]